MFFDLNIRGKDFSLDYEISKEAENLGYSDICLNYTPDKFKLAKKYSEDLNEEFNLNIHNGIYIFDNKNNNLNKISRKFKSSSDLISVHGGDIGLNRSACENLRVDVLFRPYYKRQDCGLNHVIAKEAYRNNVAIELCFVDLLRSYHHRRSKIIAHFRDIISLHRKFKFPLIISSYANSTYDLRTVRDLKTVFEFIGLSESEMDYCFNKTPLKVLEFKKDIDNLIVLGARRVSKKTNTKIKKN